MRFCMVTTFYPPHAFGGDAVCVARLAEALVRRGHEVDVVHCVDSYRALGGGAHAPVDGGSGVRVHPLSSRASFLSPLATQLTGRPLLKERAIARLLAERPPDVLHFHNVSLVGGPGLLAIPTAAIKLYTTHEHWIVCPTHVLFRFKREPCHERACFRCQLAYGRIPQLWRRGRFLERSLAHVDAFIAPSAFTMKRHLAWGPPLPFVTIPNFVPDEGGRAAPLDDLPPMPERFFLFAGRLERLKGLHTVLPAIAANPDLPLVVAGEGAERRALERLAASAPHVRFVGQLDEGRLRALYRRALGLVVPSLAIEVFGLVVLESLAEGTPALVRDLGSLAEIADASGGGLVWRTPDELVAAMRRLRDDRRLRDALSAAGRRASETVYSEETHLGRYLALVGDLATRRRHGTAARA